MPGRLPPHGSARVPEAPQGPTAKRIAAGLGGIQANPPGRRSLACPDPAPSARPVTAPCCGRDRFTVMTTVRIAHTEPWPGGRVGGRGFGFFSMLVVLADDSGGRALPVWLNGPEGHGLFRGRDDDHAYPGSAEEITAGLLRAAGVTVTGVDIDELDPALTTGPRRGREIAQATARIEWTAAGTAEPGQMPVRLGYALAMAAVTGAPVRVAGQLMDQLAVPAEGDLAGAVHQGRAAATAASRLVAPGRRGQAGPPAGSLTTAVPRPGPQARPDLGQAGRPWPTTRWPRARSCRASGRRHDHAWIWVWPQARTVDGS
jgi:hypothetical protein